MKLKPEVEINAFALKLPHGIGFSYLVSYLKCDVMANIKKKDMTYIVWQAKVQTGLL